MTEDEFKKADELHMEGKAVIGVVAIVLLILALGAYMGFKNKTEEPMYFDDPRIETENLA